MTIEPQRSQIPSRPPRPADVHFNAAYELLVAHWGPTNTRRRHTAVALLRALSARPQFQLGHRVAWSIVDVAEALNRRHVRTIYRAVAELRELPGLIRIVQVLPGELDWKGDPTWFGHIEWQAGPEWRSRVGTGDSLVLPSPPPGVTPAPPLASRQPPPGVTPPDLGLDLHLDLELKLKREPASVATTDQLNFEVSSIEHPSPLPPETETPAPAISHTDHPTPEAARTYPAPSEPNPLVPAPGPLSPSSDPPEPTPLVPEHPRLWRPRGATRPVPAQAGFIGSRSPLAPAPSSRRPFAPRRHDSAAATAPPSTLLQRELEVKVIRQHRQLAERKGPSVPISYDQLDLVASALQWLTWCRTDQEKLDLCARVSELAARKTAEKGNRANLTYTFGGPPDQPNRFFLERVADLRAEDEQSAKEHADAALTSALLGTPSPQKPPSPAVLRPSPPRPLGKPTSPRQIPAHERPSWQVMEAFKTNYARAG